jgi:hypothetical protein
MQEESVSKRIEITDWIVDWAYLVEHSYFVGDRCQGRHNPNGPPAAVLESFR